jgi:hypothetical protein
LPERTGSCRRWIVGLTKRTGGFVVWLIILSMSGRGDEFGRLVGRPLFDLPSRGDARRQEKLSVRALEALPEVLRGERSALVIATTDDGNLGKMLVSAGLRKKNRSEGEHALVPVLIVDRFETIDAGDKVSWKARGKEVILFDGFEFDLDSGQVVPPGFGGDILFSSRGTDGPQISALGSNQLYTLGKPLPVAPSQPGRPSSGRAVQPSDFNGRYTLIANGQTSGNLELSVDQAGTVSGHFRSDRNGAVYPVTGKVAADLTRKIEFTLQFPRTRQVYEGLLWTEEKNAFAGTVSMLDHPYSFVAIREGASLAPEAIELASTIGRLIDQRTKSRIVTLVEGSDRYTLDGLPKTAAELTAALSAAGTKEPTTGVIVRVPETMPFSRVNRAARLIRDAEIRSIRVAPLAELPNGPIP